MKKVLLVDDDTEIRNTINKIVLNSNTDFKEIDQSPNVEDALNKLSHTNYDLIITDIVMGKINGIEFIRLLQNLESKPEIIIISGYADFSYAKEVLGYGVRAYILKPICQEEVIEIIEKIYKEITSKNSFENTFKKLQTSIDQFTIDELNYIFVNDKIKSSEIDKILQRIELTFLNDGFYITLLSNPIEIEDYVHSNSYYNLPIKLYVDNYLQDLGYNYVSFFNTHDELVLILSQQIEFNELCDYLHNHEIASFSSGISEFHSNKLSIKKAYIEAQEALKYRILSLGNNLIYYSDIKNKNKTYILPTQPIQRLADVINVSKINSIDSVLNKIFNRASLKENHISYIESINELINEYLIIAFKTETSLNFSHLTQKAEELTNIYNFNFINNYISTLRNYILRLNECLLEVAAINKKNDDIDIAIEYIQNNYYKNLNMALVSNYVSLNYTYFSESFKKKTGLNFVDYLKQVRIEKAKELLRDSDFKIYEIAEKVGYQSSKYFTSDFTSIVGISPKEYRKS